MVLAGGTSRRFGSDKLTQSLGARTLLGSAVSGLSGDVRLVIVGPASTPAAAGSSELAGARWVQEVPAGGGPAAAMITGLRAALSVSVGAELTGGLTAAAEPVDAVLVLPGDAPRAGVGALELLARLWDAGVDAVLAVDPNGREQPLQLALRPGAARALIDLAGPNAGAGASARALVAGLTPTPLRHTLSADASFDIDTHDQLRAWQLRDADSVRRVLAALADRRSRPRRANQPLVVALAGPRGTGKSTFTLALSLRTDAVLVDIGDGNIRDGDIGDGNIGDGNIGDGNIGDGGDDRPGSVDLTVYVGPLAPGRRPDGIDLAVDPDVDLS